MSNGSRMRRAILPKPDVRLRKDRCEKCGTDDCDRDEDGFVIRRRRLTFHHIDHDPSNNKPENLMTLCRSCHDKIHNIKK